MKNYFYDLPIEIQDIIYEGYNNYLYKEKDKNGNTKNGIRPRNHESFDSSLSIEHLENILKLLSLILQR